MQTVISAAPPGRRETWEGSLQAGAAETAPSPTPTYRTARAHTGAQTCARTQTDAPGPSPRPQLLHCDLRVITALSHAPFLWDTRMGTHSSLTHSHREAHARCSNHPPTHTTYPTHPCV